MLLVLAYSMASVSLSSNRARRGSPANSLLQTERPLKPAVVHCSLKFTVRNIDKRTCLGDSIEKADSSAKRRTGLLKQTSLAEGAGLWLIPCNAIHMFFMRFPIDVVYIDKAKRVRKVISCLKPWSMSMCLRAHSVIELPVGVVAFTETKIGDQLQIDSTGPA